MKPVEYFDFFWCYTYFIGCEWGGAWFLSWELYLSFLFFSCIRDQSFMSVYLHLSVLTIGDAIMFKISTQVFFNNVFLESIIAEQLFYLSIRIKNKKG